MKADSPFQWWGGKWSLGPWHGTMHATNGWWGICPETLTIHIYPGRVSRIYHQGRHLLSAGKVPAPFAGISRGRFFNDASLAVPWPGVNGWWTAEWDLRPCKGWYAMGMVLQ